MLLVFGGDENGGDSIKQKIATHPEIATFGIHGFPVALHARIAHASHRSFSTKTQANGAMDEGSTPSLHSELVSGLTVEQGASLEITAGIETSTKGHAMKIGTNLKISYTCSAIVKFTSVLVVIGLLGFGAGPVASIGLSRC